MTPARILIVEDESLVAADLQERLQHFGYTVPAIADNATDAVARALECQPDLVLMDIQLKGGTDGVAAAARIRDQRDLPVLYLTAHSDPDTLRRARVTEPFAYLVKPFEEHELRASIEMALYRHQAESRLRQIAHWLTSLLHSIDDPILATNTEGRVLFLNPAAELLTGWPLADALGKFYSEVLRLVNERTREPIENPLKEAYLETVVMHMADDSVLVARNGSEAHIDYTASPLLGESGKMMGAVVAFRDVTQRKLAERGLMELNQRLQSTNEQFKTLFTHPPPVGECPLDG